ncbi:MAG: hypothetical protein OEY38_22800, partial [Gammaproteobacteria bacterium]|nr:hypothetical protein [Gammaproteobacteria bacterium]
MKYSTSVVLFIVFCAYCSSQLSGCARAFELASAITDPKSKTATFEPNDPPGDYYLFSANDGVHGNEMWRSDGSPQGTRLLKDLISIGHGNPRNFIAYDGAVYLIADQNNSNAQVLVYRNRKLEVLFDMATNNIPVTNNLSMFRVAQRLLLLHRNSNAMQFYSINLQGSDFRQVEGFSDTIQYLGQRGQKNENTAIFIDYTVNDTQNLWSTDGISAHLIVSPDPNIQLYWSAQIGEDIYYLLRNISQQDLWFWHSNKDGSEQELLQSFIGESRDIPGSYPMDLGDQFLFSIRNDVSAMLWRIDASGMSMIKKLNDNANSYINYRILFGDSIYFIVENNDAFELWKSNGTAAASVYLTTIANSEGLGSLEMQASRDGIYISYSDSALENKDQILFFRSDGTNATLSPTAFAHMSKIATLDDSEYFFAQTFDNEVALYKKTDTQEKVKVFFENHPSRNSLWRYYPFVLNNRLYAKAYTLEYADEIWQSDGTANGTTLLKEIVPGKQRSFGEAFIVQDNVALFSVLDPNVGLELWMSDGSANGTRLLQDFNQTLNANGSDPGEVILLDNKKLFLSNHMFNGSNLMVSDGSRLGTQVLVDTRVARYRNPLIKFNNKAIFLAYTDDNQEELHISDGTTFRLLKDLDASYSGLTFKAIAQNQTQLFFTENNRSLWVTDGSTLGTQQLLSDITGINRVYDLHAHVAGENLILFIDDNDTPVLVEDGGLTPLVSTYLRIIMTT